MRELIKGCTLFRPPIGNKIDKYILRYKVQPSKLRIDFESLYWLVYHFTDPRNGAILTKEGLRETLKEKSVYYRGIKLIPID
jgi:hypothetical protein